MIVNAPLQKQCDLCKALILAHNVVQVGMSLAANVRKGKRLVWIWRGSRAAFRVDDS